MATFIQSSHKCSQLKDKGGVGKEVVNYESMRWELIMRSGNDEVVVGTNSPKMAT